MPASSGALRTAVLDAIADRLSTLAELLVDEGSADRQVFITLQELEARARRTPWPTCRRLLTDPTPPAEQIAGVVWATPDAAAGGGRRGMGAVAWALHGHRCRYRGRLLPRTPPCSRALGLVLLNTSRLAELLGCGGTPEGLLARDAAH
ncbi:hypothetical protein ACWC0C_34245 [Streptomyces sp. NPDC001709]